jgi:hypothetical protein
MLIELEMILRFIVNFGKNLKNLYIHISKSRSKTEREIVAYFLTQVVLKP